jgi:hypothetical protein
MPELKRDARQVTYLVSQTELAAVIAAKAIELGMIDFEPDTVEIFPQGNDMYEIAFIKATPIEEPEQ